MDGLERVLSGNGGIMSNRPYERFLQEGPEVLSDAELLAIILRTGTKGEDTVSIGKKILDLSNGRNQGILGLNHLSIQELMSIRGIGEVKAVKIKCLAEFSKRMSKAQAMDSLHFDQPDTVAKYYMEQMRHLETEQIIVAMVDNKNALLHDLCISKGTIKASLISPREILIEALKYGAVYILLVHNHPSGDPTPSRQDCAVTSQLKEAAQLIEIPLLDHIIIGDQKYISFKQSGLL